MALVSQGWSNPGLSIEGTLLEMQINLTTTHPDGQKEFKIESKFILVPDEPIVVSRSIAITGRETILQQKTLPHLLVAIGDEFLSLIGKRVRAEGYLQKPYDFFFCDEAELHIDTLLDCEWLKTHQQETLPYEPELVAIAGRISQKIYPGPPNYANIGWGDIAEIALILHLNDPIDVGNEDDVKADEMNEVEKGVREIEIICSNEEIPRFFLDREIIVKGSLFHAHTAHHRRRILMMANNWELLINETCPNNLEDWNACLSLYPQAP